MKIGRNDPCPCGSGKKYKFCCLNKENDTKNVIDTEIEYEYCIIFNDNLSEQEVSNDENDILLKGIYTSIWYIMHLPRSIFDFLKINKRTEAPDRINSHNIIFVPCSKVDVFLDYEFTLVIAERSCKEESEMFMQNNKSKLGVSFADELSSQLLNQQWKEIHNSLPVNTHEYQLDIAFDKIELFKNNYKLGLTLFFMNNWLNSLDDLKKNIHMYLNNYYTEIMKLRNNMALYEYVVLNKISNVSLEKTFINLCQYVQLPITLSLIEKEISCKKKETVELAGIHNAIARNGVYIEKEVNLSDLLLEIRKIENDLKEAAGRNAGMPRSYSIWKVLKKIGENLYEMFSADEYAAIERASQIVVFSNFPIGLAIFPNHSAPLCCYKKITYRHIEPPTSMIITEMSGHIIQDMTKGLNILMIECINRDDPVRKASDESLKEPLSNLYNKGYLKYNYKEVLTIAEFYKCIQENKDIDILLVSAHGFYDDNIFSGIYVGDEKLLNIKGMRNLPKFVIFSACHVCPRGNKAYSIVEQMIQAGVLAVLGTNIPIDVYRNANLILRFIIAIISTQKGEYPFNNVLDVWQHIVSSNAVYEIRESNKRVKEWLDSKEVMVTFQRHANEVGIRYTDVYTDTIDILISMAEEGKLKRSLEDIQRTMNYFPESIFYELNGYPENIVVNKEYNFLKSIYQSLRL